MKHASCHYFLYTYAIVIIVFIRINIFYFFGDDEEKIGDFQYTVVGDKT